jgi:MFS family permease
MASRSTLKYFNYHFIVATLSCGTALMIYSYSSSLRLSCFAMFLMGLGQILLFSSTNTLIQLIAPHKFRDRFISFYAGILLGLVPLGCQFTGFLADHIGLREAVRVCGVCSFLVMIWYLFNRHHIRDHEYPATE